MTKLLRSKYILINLDVMINANLKEISKMQDIIKVHECNQKLLRQKLKSGVANSLAKTKIEHQIHNNKIIIRGIAKYIIELRSKMKDMQRHKSYILESLKEKHDTDTPQNI